MSEIKATSAVTLLNQRIQSLEHPSGLVRLTMFSHNSDGVKAYKRQVSEAVIMLFESNGYHIVNGLSEAVALLESHGYVVQAPAATE